MVDVKVDLENLCAIRGPLKLDGGVALLECSISVLGKEGERRKGVSVTNGRAWTTRGEDEASLDRDGHLPEASTWHELENQAFRLPPPKLPHFRDPFPSSS